MMLARVGETIELWGFVEGAALDAEIAPTKVVDEEEDNVGRARRVGGVRERRERERRGGGEKDGSKEA